MFAASMTTVLKFRNCSVLRSCSLSACYRWISGTSALSRVMEGLSEIARSPSEARNQLDGSHNGGADGKNPSHQAGFELRKSGFQLGHGGIQFGARDRISGLGNLAACRGGNFGLAPVHTRGLQFTNGVHERWLRYRRRCSCSKISLRNRQCQPLSD